MTPLDFASLAVGDRVQHELVVRERHEKKTGAGDPFWILTLGNATGSLDTAPVWSNQASLVEGAERGSFVQAIGTVKEYRGKRQLELTSLRVLPKGSFDLSQFVRAEPPKRLEKLWSWLDEEVAKLKSAPLRRAALLFFGDPVFREAFERAAGSTVGHHATSGGLLVHTCEVASIAQNIARVMKANPELALVGALIHDVGKVESYAADAAGFSNTPAGHLVGHIVLGSWMLNQRLAANPDHGLSTEQVLELQHFILSHHGIAEFGATVPPATAEAEIVHWADEASAKANDVLETLAEDEHFASGESFTSKRPWRVGKRLWRRPDHW